MKIKKGELISEMQFILSGAAIIMILKEFSNQSRKNL